MKLTDEQINEIADDFRCEDGSVPAYEIIRFSRALLALGSERGRDGLTEEIRKHRVEAYAEGYEDGKAFAIPKSQVGGDDEAKVPNYQFQVETRNGWEAVTYGYYKGTMLPRRIEQVDI